MADGTHFVFMRGFLLWPSFLVCFVEFARGLNVSTLPIPRVRAFPTWVEWEGVFGGGWGRGVDEVGSVAVVGSGGGWKEVFLEASVAVEDGGELIWPLEVSESSELAGEKIASVAVTIQGLVHPSPQDLHIDLLHLGRSLSLMRSARHTLRSIGIPQSPPPSVLASLDLSSAPSDGVGADVTFRSLSLTEGNVVVGRGAVMSSTLSSGSGAENAADGKGWGVWGDGSVAHTDGRRSGDAQPWWEVDLGQERLISLIRVFPRITAPDVDEVQLVKVIGDAAITGGSFSLTITLPSGEKRTTAPISFCAVAEARHETGDVFGARAGESVQSRLEATGVLGSVVVAREGGEWPGQFSWRISFLTFPGDLAALEGNVVADFVTLGSFARVEVESVVNGTADALFSASGAHRRVDGTLNTSMLVLHNSSSLHAQSVDATASIAPSPTLTQALQEAEFARRILIPANWRHSGAWGRSDAAHAHSLPIFLSPPVACRFIRVQREDGLPLALAEVAAWEEGAVGSMRTFGGWVGGRARGAREVLAEDSLARGSGFDGMAVGGVWMLRVRDVEGRSVGAKAELEHGRGSLSSWEVEVVTRTGVVVRQSSDLSFEIHTLPIHLLTSTDAPTNDSTTPTSPPSTAILRPNPDLAPQRWPCKLPSCSEFTGVGAPVTLPDSGTPPLPAQAHLPPTPKHSLFFRQQKGFLGREEGFSVKACIANQCSQPTTLPIDVKRCRESGCAADMVLDGRGRKADW